MQQGTNDPYTTNAYIQSVVIVDIDNVQVLQQELQNQIYSAVVSVSLDNLNCFSRSRNCQIKTFSQIDI